MAMRPMTSQDIANVAAAYGFTPTPAYTNYWLNWFANNGPYANLVADLVTRGYSPLSGVTPADPRIGSGVNFPQLLKIGSIAATIYALLKSSR